jgi:hypothetical protein
MRAGGGMRRRVVATIAAVVTAVTVSAPAMAADGRAQVLPPQAHPYGASYGEWGARWWQWLYGTPKAVNPAFSPAGTAASPAAVDCSAGQRGHVWFLAGTFLPTTPALAPVTRDDVYRSCTVSEGTAVFFPLLNTEADNLSCDASGTPTSLGLTAVQLTAYAATAVNDIVPGSMAASIDGRAVPGLYDGNSRYRSPSPWFSYTLPADNVGTLFGCNFPAGTTPPPPGATADGVYLMLAPLRPGTHVIHFGAETNVPAGQVGGPSDFVQNINYTITVTPRHGWDTD